ncbi:MAG: LptF/LptG family permease [Elusimicrobia bacterium]|nr:LptF/LptG family permease [Candidatus Liberimonas magnetica]
MKIIYKYILKEFVESFIFGLLVFSCILLIDQVFQLVNLLLSKGIPSLTVLKLFILVLPNILTLTIPMAVLFGILLSYGRLSEDNEITALRSTGFKYWDFTSPVLLLILSLSIFLVYFNQNIAPLTHNKFRKIYKEIIEQKPLIKFEEKAIINIDEYKVYVNKVDKKNNLIKGINIYKFSNTKDDASSFWRIGAQTSYVSVTPSEIVFNLKDGYWQKPNPVRPENLVHMKFSNYMFTIPITEKTMPFSQSLKEMKGKAILEEIKNFKQKNLPIHFLETEYWMRLTLAFAPFIFAGLGMPLGIILEKGGKSISFGFSLLILFSYYMLLITGLNIAEKGYVPPAIMLCMPNIISLVLGGWLWHNMLKK